MESALKEFHSSFQLQHILPQWEQRGLPVFEGGMFNKTHSFSQVLYLLIAECVSENSESGSIVTMYIC